MSVICIVEKALAAQSSITHATAAEQRGGPDTATAMAGCRFIQ
jgi:hypothetical protein